MDEIGLGDIVECPSCSREFAMNNLDEDEFDDFDEYFMHVSIVAERIRRKKCCDEIRAWLADGNIKQALFWLDVLEGK